MAQASITFVCGKRGSGKTERVKREIAGLSRLIVWDPMSEYDAIPKGPGLASCSGVVTQSLGDFLDYPFESVDRFRVIHRPVEDELEAEFFLRMVLARGVIPCTVVLEEADTLCNPRYTSVEMKTLIRRGRHYGVSVLAVSRNPAEISRDITRACNRFIIYSMHEPNDLKYFASFGVPSERLPTLPKFEALDHLCA